MSDSPLLDLSLSVVLTATLDQTIDDTSYCGQFCSIATADLGVRLHGQAPS